MVDPVSLTVASLQADMQRMSVIANNAANALTPGYKRELVAMSSVLAQVQAASVADLNGLGAIPVANVVTDIRPGTPRQTGNPLDLCLLGDGYFEVQTDNGVAYTRQGTFHVDVRGRLVTQAGLSVSGMGGDINLTSANPTIDRAGNVYENGKQVAKIQVIAFDDPAALHSIGGGLLASATQAAPHVLAQPQIAQGQLESSNVDSTSEMVRLLETYRHFEGSSKILQAYDDLADKTFRALGQF